MTSILQQYKTELEEELNNILAYWMKYDTDEQYGGFLGKIDHLNQADPQAEKGSVLNSRILWTFSMAYRLTQKFAYLQYARRAFQYFIDHFIDKKYGGVYWSINFKGEPSDRKKQVYAQSFAVYALSEFTLASGNEDGKENAIKIFNTIEKFSYDNSKGGYIDAFTENWSAMQDIRLSEKDANEKKTMNTHLHILEGYANLYRVWPDALLKTRIKGLLQNFTNHILDDKTNHLVLFFDENWGRKSATISYGHDIEAAWLLQEAAETINDEAFIAGTKQMAVKMAEAAKEGLDKDGGLWYEYEPGHNQLTKEKHWWPQAEAMVGFFNAWQVSAKDDYLQLSVNSWNFIKKFIRDQQMGEWVWGVRADGSVMNDHDKVGIWKCPYHNGRACAEIIKRIQNSNHVSNTMV